MHDVAVAGGGIVGLATARALALGGRRVVLLERGRKLAQHQTTHNSGVIHAGIYYTPGSLKAQLCGEGAARLYEYCEANGIDAVRCGKLVVAVRDDDLPRLDELERRARANGVPGLARLGPDEIPAVEPAARGLSALHSPNTGMVDFGRWRPPTRATSRRTAARSAAAPACARWSSARTGWKRCSPTVRSSRRARAVACAGAWSDRLALASGAQPDVRIVPFRGAYLQLRPERERPRARPDLPGARPGAAVPRRAPVADDRRRGADRPDGAARPAAHRPGARRCAGPAPGASCASWWRTGVTELSHAVSRGLLDARGLAVRARARRRRRHGRPARLRAQAVGRDGALVDDFLFAETGRAVHVLNAPSPAATASLAIADLIASKVE